jgi:undecaprenyl-diphosphatase
VKKIYLSITLLFLFIGLVALIQTNLTFALDTSIGKAFYSLHDHMIGNVIIQVGKLGSTIGIITILFLFMIIFAIKEKGFVSAFILFLSVLVGNIGNKILKAIFERERPSFVNHMEDGFSFPSGHVMVGLLLFGMIAYFIIKAIQNKRTKQTILAGTCLLLILIGFSRLLEGEHYFTDVIGGFIAGCLLLIGMVSLDKLLHMKIVKSKVKSDVAL